MVAYRCIDVLNSVYPLSPSATVAFAGKLHTTHVSKYELILPPGDVCDKLWFLEEGLVRGYYIDKHREITSWFATENQFFYSADSFLNQRPGEEMIQALEPARLAYISHQDLYELYDAHPSINHVGRMFAERYRLVNQERLTHMRRHSARERLELFAKSHRALFLRVPQKHIASHIGISEGYVSELLGKFLV